MLRQVAIRGVLGWALLILGILTALLTFDTAGVALVVGGALVVVGLALLATPKGQTNGR